MNGHTVKQKGYSNINSLFKKTQKLEKKGRKDA